LTVPQHYRSHETIQVSTCASRNEIGAKKLNFFAAVTSIIFSNIKYSDCDPQRTNKTKMASSFFAHDDSHLVTLSNGQSDTGNPATKPETRIDTGNEAGSDVSHYESIELSGMQEMLREFQKQMYTADQPGSAILIGVYVPLFVSSIVGNVLVLVLVLPFRRMRNVTHCFIVNLAVSDLLRKFSFILFVLFTAHSIETKH
jgi:hypothetical protein